MGRARALLISAGIGAGLMYFFDPERGRRRRAQLRDQAQRASRNTQTALDAAQDVGGRARGVGASIRSRFRPDALSDDALKQRVRDIVQRAASEPESIDVAVRGGCVTLSGSALADEIPLLVDRVYDIRGVHDVENQLLPQAEVQAGSGYVAAAAGAAEPERRESRSSEWSSKKRLAAGVGGAAVALYGLARGGFIPRALAWSGIALAARAATNLDVKRLTGIGARRRAVDVQKSVRINAPIERVFETWATCESYPHFMTHVRKVRRLEDGPANKRWRWTVCGPAGSEFDFDSTITLYEPNRVIAWRTEPGALLQHAGTVRFTEEPNGATRADVRMTYNPVAGAVGHVIAKLFGADAKSRINDDLDRMKSYIETGKQPPDARPATQRPPV